MSRSTKKLVLASPILVAALIAVLLLWLSTSATIPQNNPEPEVTSTTLTGRLMDAVDASNGIETPIEGATVSVLGGSMVSLSDDQGYFSIPDLPVGGVVLDIDSTTAYLSTDGSEYAGFRGYIYLEPVVENYIERPFYLTQIDQSTITEVKPGKTTIVENQNIGVTLTIEKNSAVTDDGKKYKGPISISLVPYGYGPVDPPKELGFGVMVTVQPPGITFTEPAAVTFPNDYGFSPGNQLEIMEPELRTGRFQVVGVGQVSEDGSVVETVAGGILKTGNCSGYLPEPGPGGPPAGPPPPCDECCPIPVGSMLNLANGNLSEEHSLVSYKSLNQSRSLTFEYNSTYADARPIMQNRSILSIAYSTDPPDLQSMQLIVDGDDKGTVVHDTTGQIVSVPNEHVNAIQFDATNMATGIYPYDIYMTNIFTRATPTQTRAIKEVGDIKIANLKDSEFGAGWSLQGLSRLHIQTDGSALLQEGDGGMFHYKVRQHTLEPPAASGATEGTALFFDYLSRNFDYIKFPTGAGNIMKTFPFTVETWVKPVPRVDLFTNRVQVFHNAQLTFGRLEEGHGIGAEIFGRDSQVNVIRVDKSASTSNKINVEHYTSPVMVKDHWYHIAAVYSSGNVKVFVNGQMIDDKTFTQQGLYNKFTRLHIGWFQEHILPGVRRAYSGYVDEIRVWNYALTGTEIQNNMSTQLTGSESGLIYYANFDEGQGQVLTDLAGTNNGQLGSRSYADLNDPAWVNYVLYDHSIHGDFISEPNDTSILFANTNGTYTRKLKDGTQIHFDAQGYQSSVVDRNGNTTNYAYDGQGRLTTITDPVGLVTTLAYSGNTLSTVTNPAGKVTMFEYDGSGNLTKITDPDSTFRQFAYDSSHRMTSQTSKRGFVTTYQYNFAGKCSGATRPDGSTVSMSPQWMVGLIDPASGLGTETNPAPFVPIADLKATYTDANNNTTTYLLNRHGSTIERINASGKTTITDRNDQNNATQIIDANGNIADIRYDSRGNLLSTTNQATGATTSYTYTNDGFNQIKTLTDPMNNVTNFNYDLNGNLTSVVDPLGNQTTIAYNSFGQQTGVTDALGNTVTYQYDSIKYNIEGITDQLLNQTTFTLDTSGNITTMTDAEGKTTTYSYDSMNRQTQIVDPDLALTTFGFDANSNLTTVTDARSKATTFTYDTRDRISSETDQLGNTEVYTYDGNGNLISLTNRNNETIAYQYNALNQLIQKTLPITGITTYTYDDNGNLLILSNPESTITMTYDSENRLITTSTVGSPYQPNITITNQYDLNDNRISRTDGTNNQTYSYDATNKALSTNIPSGGNWVNTFDAVGRITQQTKGTSGAMTNYTYDAAGQLTNLSNDVSGSNISSFSYTYDKEGNRTVMNTSRSSTTVNSPLNYGYDNEYRLTSATGAIGAINEAFTYDSVGNRLTELGQGTPSVYDNANRLMQDSQYTYTYDNNGNMTSKTDIATSLTTTYTYNAENVLIQISGPSLTAQYRYDGFGRRIEKNIDGVVTRYVYDGDMILQEYDGNNALIALHYHGESVDEILYTNRLGNGDFIFFTDGLGSTTELIQSSTVVQDYVYDVFGNIVSQTGTTINPYTYTGHEYDSESGLYYFMTRYYDSHIGRFIQEDIIGFGGGDINLYPYVGNNPISYVDPQGLWRVKWPKGGIVCAPIWLIKHFFGTRVSPNRGKRWDLYFHCIAFCGISKNCGAVGMAAGAAGGAGKEGYDCIECIVKKAVAAATNSNKKVECSCFDGDWGANQKGLIYGAASDVCCGRVCKSYVPKGYKD